MRTNKIKKQAPIFTHEGGKATRTDVYNELRRTVLSCMLFEDTFYESGQEVANRIETLSKQVTPLELAALAIEAREKFYLRHVPLFLARQLARRDGTLTRYTLEAIIQRPDELAEFLAIYWKTNDGKKTLSAGVKRGLANAFAKFNEYSLAKYNQDGPVKLRDVLFLTHAKPEDREQKKLYKKVAENTLKTPDTWETELSGGADKKATFERLLKEEKLGGLATLRNLRNMMQAGVNEKLIRERLEEGEFKKVLPFRFIAAAKFAPTLEDSIETAMFKATEDMPKLTGRTGILIDVSGSMDYVLSSKSDMTRLDAAAALAIYLREKATSVDVITFSEQVVGVAPRRGFALRDAIVRSQHHSGTYLKQAVTSLVARGLLKNLDRFIVITDEQSQDGLGPAPTPNSYVINVAPYKNGVSYKNGWNHVDGFSERVLDYIMEVESN